MKLHELQPRPGSRRSVRRLGRGHGSGRGKTAGRGTKGQKARAGGTIPAWFEGGQTPIHIRTPKLHGFTNRFRVAYAVVNLARLTDVAPGTLITPDVLGHDGLIRDQKTRPMPVKILGGGDAPKRVTIHAHAFTRAALAKLEAAGSTAQLISWPDGAPVEASAEPESASTPARRTSKARAQAITDGGADEGEADAGAPAEADAPAADPEAEPEPEPEPEPDA